MNRRRRTKKAVALFPLKELLKRYGVSQRKLSKSTGLALNQVSRIANNKNAPSWATVLKIATALGADLGDLRPGKDGAK